MIVGGAVYESEEAARGEIVTDKPYFTTIKFESEE